MKTKSIAIHSFRGGTGKTVIATNIAGLLARKGFNVALLDFDFRAPSLVTVFSKAIDGSVDFWLNDYLNGRCNERDILVDVTAAHKNLKGKLCIGLANPTINAIQNTMNKSRAWETVAVKKTFSLIPFFQTQGFDYCIFDTSPGIQYASINALAASDLCLIVTSTDTVDLQGTKEMLKDIYEGLDKKTYIILNKYYPHRDFDFSQRDLTESLNNHKVILKVPCYCEILQASRMGVLALQKPEHPFAMKIEEVTDKIESI
jgi:septum site-determining protein MinD